MRTTQRFTVKLKATGQEFPKNRVHIDGRGFVYVDNIPINSIKGWRDKYELVKFS